MNWTPLQIETAFGMTSITLENGVITEGAGLDLATANARLQICIAANSLMPDAEKYQVLDWLDDHGMTAAHVEAAIDQIPDETQRRKAKIRWSSINRVPADNGFVRFVAAQLNIDHTTAWWEILAK